MASITAATLDLKFGDKVLTMSPFDDKDIVELDQWLRSHVINMARQSIPDDADQEYKELLLKVAIDKATSLSWMSGEGAKLMATLEGMARLLYQGVKHNHPDETFESVRRFINSPDALSQVNEAFTELNSLPKSKKIKGSSNRKNLKRRRQQKSNKKK